jgi:hypothetical protein
MSDERRKSKRVPVLIELIWEGEGGKYEARTNDLSKGGCFVDTIGQASVGEHIMFKLKLPNGEWLDVEGDVTYVDPRIGFGIRFRPLSDADKKRMAWLIDAGSSGT